LLTLSDYKPKQPAIATLALYTHTHRAALLRAARPLAAACLIAAPLSLLACARVGAWLQLPPSVIATLLPATTTAGLALAMAPQVASAVGNESNLDSLLTAITRFPPNQCKQGRTGSSSISDIFYCFVKHPFSSC
jgi:putative effector of murein hydrolase